MIRYNINPHIFIKENSSNKEVKDLEKEFIGRGEVRGFLFRQIRVTKWGFLYEVSHTDTKYYEVFKKRINRRFATYSYPSSNGFGIWAWTFKKLDEAIDKLNNFEYCESDQYLNKKERSY